MERQYQHQGCSYRTTRYWRVNYTDRTHLSIMISCRRDTWTIAYVAITNFVDIYCDNRKGTIASTIRGCSVLSSCPGAMPRILLPRRTVSIARCSERGRSPIRFWTSSRKTRLVQISRRPGQSPVEQRSYQRTTDSQARVCYHSAEGSVPLDM